jgi:hypothetical protein
MERELIMERTRAGLEAARLQGRVGGRKRQMTDNKVQAARKLLASALDSSPFCHKRDGSPSAPPSLIPVSASATHTYPCMRSES